MDVNGEILNDGTNKLSDFMTLTPSKQDWGEVNRVYMNEPGTMWIAKGKKGVNSVARVAHPKWSVLLLSNR